MATQGHQVRETFVAGADLSAGQFKFVTLAADGQIDLSANGAAADGVLLNDPSAAGQAATVCVSGRVTVVCGGTIAAGASVASDTAGVAITAATADIILGKALEAGVAGQVISIDFFKGGNASA
jgi:hypothetical protein